jgi:hypothetical protein
VAEHLGGDSGLGFTAFAVEARPGGGSSGGGDAASPRELTRKVAVEGARSRAAR